MKNVLKKTIVWKANFAQMGIASFRYRCALPAMFLEKMSWNSCILEKNETIDKFDNVAAVILVKSFSSFDLELTKKAVANKVPVILDLCDNIFFEHYPSTSSLAKFDEIANYASLIVTTGDELASIISKKLNEKVKVIVIPDQTETLESTKVVSSAVSRYRYEKFKFQNNSILDSVKAKSVFYGKTMIKFLLHKFDRDRKRDKVLHFLKLRNAITEFPIKNKSEYKKTIIWFGTAGKSFSNFGISAILDVSKELIAAHQKVPFKLVVVSNNYEKFVELIEPLPLITEYRKWDLEKIFKDISSSDLCIVPNCKDDFNICKSPNRSLLALSQGVPVVATFIPSLAPISQHMILDNWENGIITYLTDKDRATKDIQGAKKVITDLYSGDAIAHEWQKALHQFFGINS
jgi:glycosyltransferase involved in cell wall biosynthesis